MSDVGRPRALDEAKKREVCALLSAGGSMKFAGRYVSCSAKTIRNEAQRDADFGDRLRKSQLVAQLEPLRALRQKATTHWRAAAWLLERGDPEQFARQDQKFFKPQDVANLLENIRATLQAHITDIISQTIASRVISRVMSEADLPKGRGCAYAKLSELPVGLAPDLIDPFQTSFPAAASLSTNGPVPDSEPAYDIEETMNENETSGPQKVNLFAALHKVLAEKIKANEEHPEKKQADNFPEVGAPGDG